MRDFEGTVAWHGETAVGVFLQLAEVVQLRGRGAARLFFNGGDEGGGAFGDVGEDGFGVFATFEVVLAGRGEGAGDEAVEIGVDLVEESFVPVGDLVVAAHDHGEGGGLDAADGAQDAVVQGAGAGVVHADEPVELGAGLGGFGEVVVFGGRAEAPVGGGDGFFGERGGPEAEDGLGAAGEGVDAAEDVFAFAAGVGGVDDFGDAGVVEEAADDFELVFGAGLGEVAPVAGEHGECVAAPGTAPGGVHFVGLGEADEMADRVGDEEGLAAEVAAFLFAAAERACELCRYRGFFRHDDTHRV